MRSFFRLFGVAHLWLLTLCLTGCEKPEAITSYTVPKHESIQVAVETPNESKATSVPTPGRMLAALILDGDVSWSFKALESPTVFTENAAEHFELLIKSLKFDNPAKPTWDLGEHWTELPGAGMRTANLMLGETEFSVIKLPVRSADKQEYILSNVNRWRGQLGLPRIALDDLGSKTRTIVTSDGHDALVLDLAGLQQQSAMRPMAGAAPRPTPRPTQDRPQADSEPAFTGKPPEHWTKSKPGMMQLAVYLVNSGEQSAKVSISRAGGDVFLNINRWRRQVKLAPLADASELETQEITVSEQPGLLAEIYGEGESSIVVAMVPAAKPTWFFKLQGDTAVVKSEAGPFKAFLQTVKLK